MTLIVIFYKTDKANSKILENLLTLDDDGL